MKFHTGDIVIGLGRHGTRWADRPRGTVVDVKGNSVFVYWHGTAVEDEMAPDELELDTAVN